MIKMLDTDALLEHFYEEYVQGCKWDDITPIDFDEWADAQDIDLLESQWRYDAETASFDG